MFLCFCALACCPFQSFSLIKKHIFGSKNLYAPTPSTSTQNPNTAVKYKHHAFNHLLRLQGQRPCWTSGEEIGQENQVHGNSHSVMTRATLDCVVVQHRSMLPSFKSCSQIWATACSLQQPSKSTRCKPLHPELLCGGSISAAGAFTKCNNQGTSNGCCAAFCGRFTHTNTRFNCWSCWRCSWSLCWGVYRGYPVQSIRKRLQKI